ncbi:hypothetical protein M5X06_22420 [Paenibacillus alvei]|uniref:Uncharacterized protein n=1 Tax=Paenibacillus alvei TaxID=44250 RepID=A0ABT4H3E3_PAEAL|nr:hypothetical protein [Paenibacillus alvei]MCY9763164.1 hypothetical protein [Paenibacillus alvei]MCY9769545.1 hypothetical protein [Paenibacillus alvei]
MLYIPRKSKFNEQNLKEHLQEYMPPAFDKIVSIHRRPGYHHRHYYRLESSTGDFGTILCRITFVETEKWGSHKFHIFRVEFTSNGRIWNTI